MRGARIVISQEKNGTDKTHKEYRATRICEGVNGEVGGLRRRLEKEN